jgi:hypothetical protein
MSFEVIIKSIPTQQVLRITQRVRASKLDEIILKSIEACRGLIAAQELEIKY